MTKLDKVATSQLQILEGGVVREQFVENANKSYHFYKVIVVRHICNKILGIRLAGQPANKNKSLILIKFLVVYTICIVYSLTYVFKHIVNKGLYNIKINPFKGTKKDILMLKVKSNI